MGGELLGWPWVGSLRGVKFINTSYSAHTSVCHGRGRGKGKCRVKERKGGRGRERGRSGRE